MTGLVVFVEEASARVVAEVLAERLAPGKVVQVIPHEGKRDLRISFPRKIRAWRHPPQMRFIVLHDNDQADCRNLKASLAGLVPEQQRDRTIIRIVMQALEAWYLGDESALRMAGLITQRQADRIAVSAKFRDPDSLGNPKQEFLRLHSEIGQVKLARLIAPHLDLDRNRSGSFRLFVGTLRRLFG